MPSGDWSQPDAPSKPPVFRLAEIRHRCSVVTIHGDFERSFYRTYTKRALDVVLASILLILLAPVMVVVACWVVLDSPGRAIYSQRRVGLKRREFTIYKFRSMAVHADSVFKSIPELTAEYAVHWKLVRDPRVTRCGAFIRKTSLDELPQLFNVIKGEMSIIGPRPVVTREMYKMYGDSANLITSVRPGLTGLWQTSGRSTVTYDRRIALDTEYVQKHKFLLDMKILLMTVKVVATGHGAL